jgi:hypothetical protein
MDEPRTVKDLQKRKENLEKITEGVDDHHLRREPARLPSASSLARLPLPAIRFGCASCGKGKLRLAKV